MLIRESLKLTVEQRLRNLQKLQHFAEDLRDAERNFIERSSALCPLNGKLTTSPTPP
jgi:hypothetical protein